MVVGSGWGIGSGCGQWEWLGAVGVVVGSGSGCGQWDWLVQW